MGGFLAGKLEPMAENRVKMSFFLLPPLSLISMLAHIRGRGWSKWRFSFWFGSWQKNIRWRAMAKLIKRRSGGAFSKRKITFKKVKNMKENHSYSVFRCVLASLYEGLSVSTSVRPSVRGSRVKKRENRWFWSQIMMSHVITSSYNHFIIMRTHRWPYGPCWQKNMGKEIKIKFFRIPF